MPGAMELLGAKVEPASSSLQEYSASRVHVVVRNVSRDTLTAGTLVSLIHGSSSSAGGYWGPDDTVDPNDPGNPYASFFREVLFQGRLTQPLYPGEMLEVEGVAHVPDSFTTLQQLTVSIGE